MPKECDAVVHDGWERIDLRAAAPRVLLLHFPRPEDMSRAERLGISAVIAQPMLLSDFAEELRRVSR
jgi:hypothetical protein